MLLRRRSQKVDVLKKVPLLSGLSARHLDLIARHADEVKVSAGAVLAREGSLGSEFFVILDGKAQVQMDGKVMARLDAGDLVGEMSLIDQKPRSATVIAKTPMLLLVVSSRSFSALLDDVPALRKKVMVTLCERLRAVDAALAVRN
jgi:CRP/FNR family cyclic AMP-dependent transcriptional regulator